MSKYSYVMHDTAADVELAEDEAIAAIIILGMQVSAGDGEAEFSITNTIGSLEYFEEYTPEDFVELAQAVLSLMQENGPGPLFKAAVSQVPEDMAEEVLDMVVKVTISDREITEEEINYMSAVGVALEIPEEIIEEIVAQNLQEYSEEDEEEDEE